MGGYSKTYLPSPLATHPLKSSMPSSQQQQRIAIVGGGVSGLAAAWHLHTQSTPTNSVDVHIFEADKRLGGHAHTITVDTEKFTARDYINGTAAGVSNSISSSGSAGGEEKKNDDELVNDNNDNSERKNPNENEVDVDVGFMVYNKGNYPNMTKWFESLNVKGEDTDMSLSVSLDHGKKEWSSHSVKGLFANPLNLVKPEFFTFLKDLMHFNSNAGELLLRPENDPARQVTIQEYLTREGYSEAFASYYLLPMMAALWSASVEDVMAFPASSLVEFMCNHKMLQLFNRPQYKTPAGRSIQYTTKMASILGEKAHTNTPIVALQKKSNKSGGGGCEYELFTNDGVSVGCYDHVIFACHSPQVAEILNTDESKTIDQELVAALNKIEYGDNAVYVHSDPTLMPTRKAAWGSWNCVGKSDLLTTHRQKVTGKEMEGSASGFGNTLLQNGENETVLEGEDGRMRAVYVTYYVNRLQNLSTSTDIFVSLNPHTKPNPDLVYRRQIMAHPQFSKQTHEGRSEIKKFQGKDGLW